MARSARQPRKGRKWIVWLAVVALLVHGLVPLAAAWAASDGADSLSADLHKICTANGLQALDEGQAPPTDRAAATCVFCLVHSLAIGNPATASLALPAAPADESPAAATASHPDLWHSTPRLPRGPPATV
ncbi:MAG: DUF2946 family protein [Magnetospirillum sp. WYHS-4]